MKGAVRAILRRFGFGQAISGKDANQGISDALGPENYSVEVLCLDSNGKPYHSVNTSGRRPVEILRPYGAPTKVTVASTTAVSLLPSGCDAVVVISATEVAASATTFTVCGDSGKAGTIAVTSSLTSSTGGFSPTTSSMLLGSAYGYASGATALSYVMVQGYKVQ